MFEASKTDNAFSNMIVERLHADNCSNWTHASNWILEECKLNSYTFFFYKTKELKGT